MEMKRMKYILSALLLTFAGGILISCENKKSGNEKAQAESVEVWLTTPDKKNLFSQAPGLEFVEKQLDLPAIVIDRTERFQTVDGFGYTLTGGSAWLMHQMLSAENRAALIRELFSTDSTGIGVSYLRISVGASDLDARVFSYNDMPDGKTDPELKQFSIAPDETHLIPVLQEILAVDPSIKIMGSPWSAPAWMKTNNSPKGGSLKPQYYGAYAQYLVKYIEAMANAGITIDAITIQNEPENPKNNPSMVMTAEEQADFVKNHLGPAFQKSAIKTKIVVFDHNCDNPDYPIAILNDPEAKKWVDGSAFHLYLGEIEAMSKVHEAHPDKNLYFTEQWTSPEGSFNGDLKWHTKNLTIGAMRNWSRTVLEWNLAADPEFQPHTDDGGCTQCLGALTIDGNNITRNVSYYIIAHASKFVRPGSVRIASSILPGIPNVAFETPDERIVLIALNDSEDTKEFLLDDGSKIAHAVLEPGDVATYVWK
jgi:glucosylceramidase